MRRIHFVVAACIVLLLGAPAHGAQLNASKKGIEKRDFMIHTGPVTMKSLANRPDTDIVQINGRNLNLGKLRRLDERIKQSRLAARQKVAAMKLARPAATGTPVKNSADIAAALKRGNDNETLQLPQGQRLTVSQLKFAQKVNPQLTRLFSMPTKRPNLTGNAIKISRATTRAEAKNILTMRDGTVLESPSGKRITVGELKQWMAQRPPAKGGAAPASFQQRKATPAGVMKKK